tara:strand:- start:5558 stop:6433 length:876 start_codon:yes stop_codon:yes gene_type:complete
MKIIKYIIEAVFIYLLFFLMRLIGLNLGRKISSYLFLNIGFFFRSKKLTKKNISNALGNIADDKLEDIIKSMWKNYGLIFAEYMYLKKFRLNKFSKPHISVSGKEILDQVIKSDKPTVFISGHFANFELMAMELEKNNINLAAIYRPLNNFLLNPYMVFIRKKYICKNQIKKGLAGTKEVIGYMKKKYSVALMVDQRLGESERYPFFNKPAHTTTLPAQLALRFDCNIIPVYLERDKNNFFKMEILNPIEINKTDNLENDKKTITIKINQIIEKMILRNPEQWIWTHGRWK